MMYMMQPEQPSKLPSQPAKPSPTPAPSSSTPPPLAIHPVRAHDNSLLRTLLSFVGFVALIFILASAINAYVFQSYYVDGTSMNPTLQNSDRLVIDKLSRSLAHITGHTYVPKRGEIVVLDSSLKDTSGNFEQLIKRVIGLPGDRLVIKSGTVTVYNSDHPDGFDVDASLGLHLAPTYVPTSLDITIPDDSIFVMGDNRAAGGSYDSRAFGPVKLDKVEGRLWLRILPVDTFRAFN
jgi:signal peptidase I